ncbi:hypothetical protein D9Q98_010386 [Chlorella vulgaris]|uniref:EF-hand domain-containing protein n=1 Tax=Chlorella vulgaris TaxID=3077 RepID=A0A9D4TS38_CHLVU|nr:hypothetical protein D9Q98_010386 [Chlorella vulgaris]
MDQGLQQVPEGSLPHPSPSSTQTPARRPTRGKLGVSQRKAAKPALPASASPLAQAPGQQTAQQQPQAQQPRQQPQTQQRPQQQQPRQQRKKKTQALFDPSAAEVDACFAQLAQGESSGVVTEQDIMQVGRALGSELEPEAVHNMMRMAAESVLGWSSGAGRHRGASGTLNLPEFRRLVEHFRVTATA